MSDIVYEIIPKNYFLNNYRRGLNKWFLLPKVLSITSGNKFSCYYYFLIGTMSSQGTVWKNWAMHGSFWLLPINETLELAANFNVCSSGVH